MELYNSPFSTCSQKVRLCLAEKRVEWVDRRINFSTREHLTPEYLALNPNGVVPTLVDDGDAIIDSSVICEYLEEVKSTRPLMPDSPADRARVRAWMRYIEEVPTVAIRVPSFNKLFSAQLSKVAQAGEFEAHAESLPLRKHFYLKMNDGRFSDAEYEASLERLEQTIHRMDLALRDADWLVGHRFTLADLILIPLIVRMEDLGLSFLWDKVPTVPDWYARVQDRPSFAVAFYAGARITPDAFSFEIAERGLGDSKASEGQA